MLITEELTDLTLDGPCCVLRPARSPYRSPQAYYVDARDFGPARYGHPYGIRVDVMPIGIQSVLSGQRQTDLAGDAEHRTSRMEGCVAAPKWDYSHRELVCVKPYSGKPVESWGEY